MKDAQANTIYLKDYRPPAFWITHTELYFQLYEDHALVTATLDVRRNEQAGAGEALQLHGQQLTLESLAVDGRKLQGAQYSLTDDGLTIADVPDQFQLTCVTRIYPQDNSSLEGLYKSRTMFCTQCEAEGFRKITYYLDRPDVMATFTVTIEADARRYPVLLSNGNLQVQEALADGRHRSRWHDPFPKPAYLFALVAGDLACVDDSFHTVTGRDVALKIFVEEKDIGKCEHAMRSLKHSMRWDEEVYGREYDLDIFNIVAVDDFNMGAMENKSLNIFNSSCVLCSPETTTDTGFQTVEAIVAHEYFHNWSGNRVTCRDWFQLSLKEGFTVFRDAQFSADMGSPTVKRIADATTLRTAQFAEDAGPMAHPVRPDSFIEISNFYTLTVYEKGAEVVRMIHTLLGEEGFRAGSDLYFSRHDGQAVTCEDFVCAMEDASGIDLTQFRNWYSQAGTPELTCSDHYDEDSNRYRLTVRQSCPATPGQSDKDPFVIPLSMGLLGDAGNLPLKLAGEAADHEVADNTSKVLLVDEAEKHFDFEGVMERPVPSLLRGFSAPIRLHYDYSRPALAALMSRDDDGFVRWDAGQKLALSVINELQHNPGAATDTVLIQACDNLLEDTTLDPAMVAAMLQLPSEALLAEQASQSGGADVHAIYRARNRVREDIAKGLPELLLQRYQALANDAAYRPDAPQIASRSLRNTCLDYLASGSGTGLTLAREQYDSATNMTDQLAALRVLAFYGSDTQRQDALDSFYQQWHREVLVVNQWFQVQAMISAGDPLARVQALMQHADFDMRNPNKVRALIGGFCNGNAVGFHRADGEGYRLLADVVAELNTLNPQIASRLLTPLTKWRNYSNGQAMMRGELERLASLGNLSSDVYEVVTKSLG
jgi:aminopeptidase N